MEKIRASGLRLEEFLPPLVDTDGSIQKVQKNK